MCRRHSPWPRSGLSKPPSWPAPWPSWLGCKGGCGRQPGGLELQCKHIMSIFTSAWSQNLPLPSAASAGVPGEPRPSTETPHPNKTLLSQALVSPAAKWHGWNSQPPFFRLLLTFYSPHRALSIVIPALIMCGPGLHLTLPSPCRGWWTCFR